LAHDLIDSTEMYLRTVLELEEEGIPALRARLSERLGLSAPSISEGSPGSRIRACSTSRRTGRSAHADRPHKAVQVMRKHRLAERLLADVIGLDPEYIHEEACRWEHVISDRVEARLAELLGNPTTSPYGNPIPGADTDGVTAVPLADVEGGRVRLHSLSEQLQGDAEIIHVLYEHGLVAGETVEVTRTDGEVMLELDGHRVPLPNDTARMVYVTPC
jgi:DtxR family transcriptional regulator, Mn-dependent transcriptional regulator